LIYPLKNVIFNSYVSLPEGISKMTKVSTRKGKRLLTGSFRPFQNAYQEYDFGIGRDVMPRHARIPTTPAFVQQNEMYSWLSVGGQDHCMLGFGTVCDKH